MFTIFGSSSVWKCDTNDVGREDAYGDLGTNGRTASCILYSHWFNMKKNRFEIWEHIRCNFSTGGVCSAYWLFSCLFLTMNIACVTLTTAYQTQTLHLKHFIWNIPGLNILSSWLIDMVVYQLNRIRKWKYGYFLALIFP